MNCIIDGIQLHYEDSGAGKAILFLHGWGANGNAFDCVTRLLEGYRIIKLDFPGFGQSAAPAEPWDVDRYTLLTSHFIQHLGLERVSLVAHSFGGRVVIKLNRLEKPFAIDKIVLIDSAGVLPPKTLKKTLRSLVYKTGKAVLCLPPVKALFPDALEHYKRRMGSADYNSLSGVMRDTLVRVVNEDLTPYLAEIRRPTLLIWGDQDTATPMRDARIMEQQIPDAGLYVIEGAGHFSYLTDPYLVARAIQTFI